MHSRKHQDLSLCSPIPQLVRSRQGLLVPMHCPKQKCLPTAVVATSSFSTKFCCQLLPWSQDLVRFVPSSYPKRSTGLPLCPHPLQPHIHHHSRWIVVISSDTRCNKTAKGTGGSMLTTFCRNLLLSVCRGTSRPCSFLGIFQTEHAARTSCQPPPSTSSKESTPVTTSGDRTRVLKFRNSSAFSSAWPTLSLFL